MASVTSDDLPRAGRGLLARAVVAAVVIVRATAGSVAAAVILEVEEFGDTFFTPGNQFKIPGVTRAEAGEARTVLIIGSDRRSADRGRGRADTLLLMRVDPDADAITLTSIPRDLRVAIPGHGTAKVNEAYADGGERLAVRTLKRLLSRPGDAFEINNVVNVNFGGFRRAINAVGGVYADIDRTYRNTNEPPTDSPLPYATIDVPAGYQKLKGQAALDYVRYRHTDNDLVRAARQQDFLRQIRSQPGARRLLAFGQRNRLARLLRRDVRVDASLRSSGELLAVARLAIFSLALPVRQVPFQVSEDGAYLTASERQLRATLGTFLHPRAEGGRRTKESRAPARRRPRPSAARRSVPAGLVRDRTAGEDLAVLGSRRLGFPFYFPALRHVAARYEDARSPGRAPRVPRVYTLRDQAGVARSAAAGEPVRGATGGRARPAALLRRAPPPARRLEDRSRRLLGLQHADEVALERPDARDRRLADPAALILPAILPRSSCPR